MHLLLNLCGVSTRATQNCVELYGKSHVMGGGLKFEIPWWGALDGGMENSGFT